ncbi:polysaccharide pyruvyl transferase family protein [Pseudomonadota bacterium]
MKIGLITYHHVVNPGSILQTYCGYKLLQSVYPKAAIEIVDYYPTASQEHNRSQAKIFDQWHDSQLSYAKFLRKHCKFSAYKIRMDNIERGVQDIVSANYDLVVSGSDTVFQVDGYLGKYLAGPPAPNLYYLPFRGTAKKVGLSVSFDPPQNISSEKLGELAEYLNDFDMLFYRDQHAGETLQQMGIKEERLAFTPDPTIMFDIQSLLPKKSKAIRKSEKVIGISIANDRISASVKGFLATRGFLTVDMLVPKLQIQSRSFWNPLKKPERMNSNSIEARLSKYLELSGLVTDRFHGAIFAMQLGDYPVIGIEDATVYKSGHGKLWDLFGRLGLENSMIRVSEGQIHGPALESAWDSAVSMVPEVKAQFAKLRSKGIDTLVQGMKQIATQ